ncbi:unnamed protein product [Meloidogyne enterolobii]|uniref:Uncharacterized protein n=1 Tax=Meloidogyne enterolobii TaxID=390850 RepID=A0ACB0XK84_MELEN
MRESNQKWTPLIGRCSSFSTCIFARTAMSAPSSSILGMVRLDFAFFGRRRFLAKMSVDLTFGPFDVLR